MAASNSSGPAAATAPARSAPQPPSSASAACCAATTARAQIARSRVKTLRALQRAIDGLAGEIRDKISRTGTTLKDIEGVGDLVAADIGTEAGRPHKIPHQSRVRDGQRNRPHRSQLVLRLTSRDRS